MYRKIWSSDVENFFFKKKFLSELNKTQYAKRRPWSTASRLQGPAPGRILRGKRHAHLISCGQRRDPDLHIYGSIPDHLLRLRTISGRPDGHASTCWFDRFCTPCADSFGWWWSESEQSQLPAVVACRGQRPAPAGRRPVHRISSTSTSTDETLVRPEAAQRQQSGEPGRPKRKTTRNYHPGHAPNAGRRGISGNLDAGGLGSGWKAAELLFNRPVGQPASQSVLHTAIALLTLLEAREQE